MKTVEPKHVEAGSEPALVLRPRELCSLLGVSETSLWRWRQAGRFPRAIRLGPGSIAWRRGDIEKWLATRDAA